MILSLLYSLGFSVILTSNVSDYCGCAMHGCFLPETKQVVVDVNTKYFRKTFYHEAGHALTYNDTELYKLANKKISDNYRNDHSNPVYELMADWYMSYRLNTSSMKIYNPEIINYFNYKKWY